MNSFPVDDATLLALEHALGAYCEVDEAGEHHMMGAEYSMSDLLQFLSGFDEDKLVPVEDDDDDYSFYYPDPLYSEEDVIEALVAEVRRLRGILNESLTLADS